MTLTLNSLPEWAPEILRTLYLGRKENQLEISNNPLLEKLISDSRMESVWKTISKLNSEKDYEDYVFSLFLCLSVLTSFEEPRESLGSLRKRYARIATQARKLIEAMKDSILDREMRSAVTAIASSADELAEKVDISFLPYRNTIIRYTDNPIRTMLARRLYQKFTRDFNTPLWGTIATLVAVVCDAHPGEITIDMVRSCCEGVVKPKEYI